MSADESPERPSDDLLDKPDPDETRPAKATGVDRLDETIAIGAAADAPAASTGATDEKTASLAPQEERDGLDVTDTMLMPVPVFSEDGTAEAGAVIAGDAEGENGPIPKRTRRVILAVIAACAILLAVGIGIAYSTEAATVVVESDATIELGVDCFGVTIRATAENDEGTAALETCDSLRGMSAVDAVGTFVDASAKLGHVDGNVVLATVCSSDVTLRESLSGAINDKLTAAGYNPATFSDDPSAKQEASAAGLSVGRYEAYLQISGADTSFSTKDAANSTLPELKELLGESRSSLGEETEAATGGSKTASSASDEETAASSEAASQPASSTAATSSPATQEAQTPTAKTPDAESSSTTASSPSTGSQGGSDGGTSQTTSASAAASQT